MDTFTPSRQQSGCHGFSLLEVLVAIVVLSIGILGLASLQLQGLKFGTDSYLRTQATIIATDIIDRMMANRAGADNGSYIVAEAPTTATSCGDDDAGCTSSADLAQYDLKQWYDQQKKSLPTPGTPSSISRSIVDVGAGVTLNRYTVTVRWMERDIPVEQSWVVDL